MTIVCPHCGWTESGAYLPGECPSCDGPLEEMCAVEPEEMEEEPIVNPEVQKREVVMESGPASSVREATITIGSLQDDYRTPVPFIRLRGKWLEKLGLSAGTKLQVLAREGSITLIKKQENSPAA